MIDVIPSRRYSARGWSDLLQQDFRDLFYCVTFSHFSIFYRNLLKSTVYLGEPTSIYTYYSITLGAYESGAPEAALPFGEETL